jgi:LEM3 (ligand-effect modulator 3) family / CDC50 family
VQWSQTVQYYGGQPVDEVPSGGTAAKVDTKMCSLFFQIPDDIGFPNSPVLLYYRLTNFYQNHRRYVKSFDSDQLAGPAAPNSGAINSSQCDPLTSNGSRPYYPCGVVANSQFNDTFSSPLALNAVGAQGPVTYPMTNKGIAWDSDKTLYSSKCQYSDLSSIAVPPFWEARWPNGAYSDANPPPSLQNYEEFQVWMRTAGLPDFSKLALRNDNQTMKAGRYRLDIGMSMAS